MQRGFIDLTDVKTMYVTEEQAQRLELRERDLLFVEGNSIEEVGRVAVWSGGEPTVFQNSLVRARLTSEELDCDFVVLWFNSPSGNEYVRRHATTTSGSLWHIGAGKLADAPIPIPPLHIQRRLVEEYAKLTSLARKAESTAKEKERAAWERFGGELVCVEESTAIGELTRVIRFMNLNRWDEVTHAKRMDSPWPVSILRDVSEIRLGVQVPRRNSAPAGPPRPYLRAANIKRWSVDTADVKKMHVGEQQAKALELQDGDLLFVEGSGSPREVGRCAVWDGSIEGAIHQNSVIRARLLVDSLDVEFVSTWFNSPAGNAYIRRHATTTSGLYHIGAGKLSQAPVPQPPLEVQRQLVQQLRAELAAAGQHALRASSLFEEAEEIVVHELFG